MDPSPIISVRDSEADSDSSSSSSSGSSSSSSIHNNNEGSNSSSCSDSDTSSTSSNASNAVGSRRKRAMDEGDAIEDSVDVSEGDTEEEGEDGEDDASDDGQHAPPRKRSKRITTAGAIGTTSRTMPVKKKVAAQLTEFAHMMEQLLVLEAGLVATSALCDVANLLSPAALAKFTAGEVLRATASGGGTDAAARGSSTGSSASSSSSASSGVGGTRAAARGGAGTGSKRTVDTASSAAAAGATAPRASDRQALQNALKPPKFFNGHNTCFLELIILLYAHIAEMIRALLEDEVDDVGGGNKLHRHDTDESARLQCLACNTRKLLEAASAWTSLPSSAALSAGLPIGQLMQSVAHEVRSVIHNTPAPPILQRDFFEDGEGVLYLDDSPTSAAETAAVRSYVQDVNGNLPATQEDAPEAVRALLRLLEGLVGRRVRLPTLAGAREIMYCPHAVLAAPTAFSFDAAGSPVVVLHLPDDARSLARSGVLPFQSCLDYSFQRTHHTVTRDVTACSATCDKSGMLPVVGCRGSTQPFLGLLPTTSHIIVSVQRVVAVAVPGKPELEERKVTLPIELPSELDLSAHSVAIRVENDAFYLDHTLSASSEWHLVGYGIQTGSVRGGHYTTWHRRDTSAPFMFFSNGTAAPVSALFDSKAELAARGSWYVALYERKPYI